MIRIFVPLLLFVAAVVAEDGDLAPRLRAGIVELRVSNQSYETTSPWNKTSPGTKTGLGFVVEPGIVLTPAVNVRNHVMIEASVANSARRYPAELKHVDYRAGLALVKITDPELLAKLEPLELGAPVQLDDEFDIYYLGGDNMVERTSARVVRSRATTTRLNLQLQAAGLDRGNGQVAIREGKVVGLITGTQSSKQRATMLSLETIRHYLDDFKKGDYNGLPGSGIYTQTLLRDDLRDFYGVSKDQHGVAVTRVRKGRTGDGVLKVGDVLLKLDGYDLDDEGKFEHEVHGRLGMAYLLTGNRYAGEKIKAAILRDGKEQEVEIELKRFPRAEQVVPSGVVDGRPEFLVVGGMVIFELDGSRSGGLQSDGGLVLRRYRDHANWDPPEGRRRIVYVDRVVSNRTNKGYEDMRHATISTVNGQKVGEIKDVATALEKPLGDFHVFTFEGGEVDFVVRADQLEKINADLKERYGIKRLRYLDGDPE